MNLRTVVLLAVTALSGGLADAEERPNVVLITLDTVRADRMGFQGSKRGLTPHLDAVAKQGVVFEKAYAQAPLTPIAHASILTGLYPASHGVQGFGSNLRATTPYLAEILRQQGYRTGAFVGSIILDPRNGFAPGFERGFDVYDAGFRRKQRGENRYGVVEKRAADVVGPAINWIGTGGAAAKPFLAWLHIWDAHDPYDPPQPFARQFASKYDGEIAYLDSALGKLFDALRAKNLYDNTIIVLVSDHGEALGDHGEQTHGVFLYDSTIQVPFFIKLPSGRMAGVRTRVRAGQVDVLPTILEGLSISVPPAVQGTALLRLAAQPSPADRPSFATSDYPKNAYGWSPISSSRVERFLYVQAPTPELYDLIADPATQKNLAPSDSRTVTRMSRQLQDFLKRLQATSAPQQESVIDAQTAERLRSLGYVASSGASAKSSGIDPKLRIHVHNLMHDANMAIEEGRADEAIPLLLKVVATDSEVHTAQYYLGLAYAGARQFAKAIPYLRRAIELQPDGILAHYEMGLALFETGEWKTAAVHFEIVVSKNPQWIDARYSLAAVQARTDRVPEGMGNLLIVIDQQPEHYRANLLMGRLLTLKNQASEALPYLETAIGAAQASAEAHLFLAEAYERLGRRDDALRARARAAQLRRPGTARGQSAPPSP